MKFTSQRHHGSGVHRLLRWLMTTGSIFFMLIASTCSYLIVVNETTEPTTVIFNASVYKLGSEREYKLNAHKSAHFVHRLLHIDSRTGQISLKRSLSCDGVYYPNLFTFYIDSTSTRLRSIDYYSMPIRIFVAGINCIDNNRIIAHQHLLDDDNNRRRRRRRRDLDDDDAQDNRRVYGEYQGKHFHLYRDEFPWLFAETNDSDNELLQMLSRKRRTPLEAFDQNVYRRIADAKQWVSETYASYAIHTTDKWNQICLKQSQFINSLRAFLPRTICQHCKTTFVDVSDERFMIERSTGDLVAAHDVCIPESMWRVIVTMNVRCGDGAGINVIDAYHRLKIVYHHQEFNDTDIAKRVRRELRNQSPFFEKALYVATVLEEQPVGTAVTTVRARDPEDSPVVYSMVSLLDSRSQSMFKVDSRSGSISTATALDRELMDVHYFRVVATDDSFPPRSGTTTLQVNVLDCNDHGPSFEADQFDASIREGATVGSTVITLRATDQDIGKNKCAAYFCW